MTTITGLYDASAIVTDAGSDYGNFAKVLSSTSGIVLDSNIASLPVIKSISGKKDVEQKSIDSAQGRVYYTSGGKTTGSLEVTTIQNNGDAIGFCGTYGNEYVAVCLELTPVLVNGKAQYAFFPWCRVSPSYEVVKPGQEVKINFQPMASPKQFTVSMPNWTVGFNNVATTGATTVLATGEVMKIIEL